MTARILDGKRIADELLERIKGRVGARVAAGKSHPGLAVVLVGADPASAGLIPVPITIEQAEPGGVSWTTRVPSSIASSRTSRNPSAR